MKKTVKMTGLLLALTMASAALVSNTFAKYTTTVQGGDTATAESFAFTVKDSETNFAETDLITGLLLPGASDDFRLDLSNASSIPVDIDYAVTATSPFPIMYCVSDVAKTTLTDEDYTVTGDALQTSLSSQCATLNAKTNDVPTAKTIYVYWKWVEDDATDINFQGKPYNLNISVTASQQ